MNNLNICPDFEELEKLAQGSLSAERASQLRRHISTCKDCRELYESLTELGCDYVDSVSAELNERVDKRVAKSQKQSKSIVFSIAKYAAAAAIVGLAVLGVYHLTDGTQQQETLAVESAPSNSAREDAEALAVNESETSGNEDVLVEMDITTPQKSSENKSKGNTVSSVDVDNTVTLRGRADNAAVEKQLSKASRSVGSVDPSKFDEKFKKANQLIAEGEYFDAKDELEDILNEDPDNYEAYKTLGICNMKLKYYNQAIENFKKLHPSTSAEKREIDSLIRECMDLRLR